MYVGLCSLPSNPQTSLFCLEPAVDSAQCVRAAREKRYVWPNIDTEAPKSTRSLHRPRTSPDCTKAMLVVALLDQGHTWKTPLIIRCRRGCAPRAQAASAFEVSRSELLQSNPKEEAQIARWIVILLRVDPGVGLNRFDNNFSYWNSELNTPMEKDMLG